MSNATVDLGAIAGDWDFHARYVTNSLEQTLKRLHKTWRALKRQSPVPGQVPMDGALMEEFLECCRQTRALTDDVVLMQETRPAKPVRAAAKRARGKKARAHK
jgi:hypothetical protein